MYTKYGMNVLYDGPKRGNPEAHRISTVCVIILLAMSSSKLQSFVLVEALETKDCYLLAFSLLISWCFFLISFRLCPRFGGCQYISMDVNGICSAFMIIFRGVFWSHLTSLELEVAVLREQISSLDS